MRKGSVHCSWHGIRWIGPHSLEKSNHAKEASWENLRKIDQAVEISMNFHRHVSVRNHSIFPTSLAKRTNISFQEVFQLSWSRDTGTYPIAVNLEQKSSQKLREGSLRDRRESVIDEVDPDNPLSD